MQFTGLSLDQAPPLKAPLRFFLSAPLFAMAAGIVIMATDGDTLSMRHAPETIAVVHLVTIGFFAMVMFGALQQMLPVLAGVSLPRPVAVAATSHAAIAAGTAALCAGMYLGVPWMLEFAAAALGTGFAVVLGAVGLAMRKVTFVTPTVGAMIIAAAAATVTALLGLHLLGAYWRGDFGVWHLALANAHVAAGVFGFATILAVGVSFQVLPMFYVAEPFSGRIAKALPPLLLLAVLLWAVGSAFESLLAPPATGMLAAVILFFAVTVLRKLYRRRRPIRDVTVVYWYFSALLLLSGVTVWLFGTEERTVMAAALLIGGALMALMTGMLYKIVPFLAWFHLNAAGYFTIPTMREMLCERLAWAQQAAFAAALAALGAALAGWIAPYWGGAALSVSMGLLLAVLLKVVRTYTKIRSVAPEFSFDLA